MDAFGLYLMFSMLATQVLPSPNKRVEYPLGLLPCRIFQGETYRSLSRIIRNMVLMYPGGDIRYEQSGLSDARDYIEQCFLYDEFRPASHLGLASFFRVMETISYHGPRNFLIQAAEMMDQGDDLLIPVSDVVSMKDFLSLCFDFYLVDLINGHDAFAALASIQAGVNSDSNNEVYARFVEETKNLPAVEMKLVFDPVTRAFNPIYRVTSFQAYMCLEYMQMLDQNVKFRRCQNPACGKFFVAQRTTAKYCDFPSPQNELKTCKELYPQVASREKTTKDAVLKSIRGAQSRLYNVRRRHPEQSEAINRFLDEIDARKESMSEKVVTGEITLADFNKWLESLTIKKERNT